MEYQRARFFIHETPSEDSTLKIVKDMSDRFTSEDSDLCPILSYQISKVLTRDGDVVPYSDWKDILSLTSKGLLTMSKFDVDIDRWQVHLTAKNEKITSDPEDIVDVYVKAPFDVK